MTAISYRDLSGKKVADLCFTILWFEIKMYDFMCAINIIVWLFGWDIFHLNTFYAPSALNCLTQISSPDGMLTVGCCRCLDWRVHHLEERLRWGLVGDLSICETWISAVIPASWASTAYAGLQTQGKVLSTELTLANSRYLDKWLTQISRLGVYL